LASLIPGAIVFAVLQRKRRGVAVRALAAVVIVWGAVAYFAPGAVSNYSERLGSEGVVDYGRLLTAATALEDISQRPILGWGINHLEDAGATFLEEVGDFMGVHNTFLAYWYSMGLLGAAGFLMLFVIPIRNMLRLLNEKLPDDSVNTLRLSLACYAFFFIVSNLGPYIYSRFLYVPMFVFAGFAAHAPLAIKFHETTRRAVAHLPARSIQATS
jgi:O-antigen ligase